jgi:hypothetical protein
VNRWGRHKVLLVAGLALIALCAVASPACADDSQFRISEVYSDASPTGHGDFIELQMLASGQQFPSGSAIRLCTATGGACVNYMFPDATLPQPVTQQTVLVGWDDNPQTDFGIPMAFNIPPLGGSACYEHSVSPLTPLDCVAWGTYTAGAVSVETPAPALNAGQSLTRTESRGCPTLMDLPDDTDDSAADFSLAAPTPRNNGQAATETQCPLAAPPPAPAKKKCKKKKRAHRSAEVAKKKKCKHRKRR